MFTYYFTTFILVIAGALVTVYVPEMREYSISLTTLFIGLFIGGILTQSRMNAIRAAKRNARIARER